MRYYRQIKKVRKVKKEEENPAQKTEQEYPVRTEPENDAPPVPRFQPLPPESSKKKKKKCVKTDIDWNEMAESRGKRRESGAHVIKLHENRKRKRQVIRVQRGRGVNTREYAIAWGVLNKPYSSKELYLKCKGNPNAPAYNYIVNREWKGFLRYYNALVKAGMEPRSDKEKRRFIVKKVRNGFSIGLLKDDKELVKFAALHKLTTITIYTDFLKNNKEMSGIIPTANTVIHRFGTWRRFKYEVLKYNIELAITEYVKLSARYGHWLRLWECDKYDIPIREAMNLLRSSLFNAVCYRKLRVLGLDETIPADGGSLDKTLPSDGATDETKPDRKNSSGCMKKENTEE